MTIVSPTARMSMTSTLSSNGWSDTLSITSGQKMSVRGPRASRDSWGEPTQISTRSRVLGTPSLQRVSRRPPLLRAEL